MRKLLIVFLLAGSLPLPARAAATGVIEGRVLHGDDDRPIASAEVTLTQATTGAERETLVATTGRDGAFRFPDLPTGDDHLYALDVTYDGGLFPGRALTLPDDTDEEPVVETTVRVWDTTTEPDAIVVQRNDLFVVESEGAQVGVIETVQLTNTAPDAYIGRGRAEGAGSGDTPSLGFSLPASAELEQIQILDASLDVPQLVRTDFGFGITTAIPPGQFSITFSYPVPGSAGSYDLSRRTLYDTLNLAVFASEELSVRTNRLDENEAVEIEGRTYVEHSTDEPLDAGDSVQVVALADAGTPPGLVAGMAGALVLVAALGALPLIMSRRRKAAPAADRSELLRQIAELDIRHERGEIDDEAWTERRSRLRAEIARRDEG